MKQPERPPDCRVVFEKNHEEIFKYLTREDVQNFINRINNKYYSWEEFKYKNIPEGTKKELLWSLVKFIRRSDLKTLKFNNLNSFVFKYKLTNDILQKLHEFDLNLGGSLGSSSLVPEEDREKYLISSIMEEAIASSRLEGAVTTRRIAKEMLKMSRKPKNKSEKMIVNNYLTIKRIVDIKDKKLTKKVLFEIHKCITKGTLDNKGEEGRFRETNDVHVVDNRTGESFYVPPDYKLISQLMDDFCDFANKNKSEEFIHPIIKATMLHFLIGYIHPFTDGNGRTARAIFYWYLLTQGYWLVEYMSISRTILKSPIQYARAYLYTETDENDLTYFIKYQIRTMDFALKDLREYIKNQIKERDELYNFLGIGDLNSRQSYILKKFSETPKRTMTIKEVENTFDVVYQTARTDILELERMGFLIRKKTGKQKFLFLRSEQFDDKLKKILDQKN
ncbi:MAG: Fic family protein [Candidatus Aenigmarchaeota archaeon]|nr:Fic family protein [Candidatus Aenigmarchaeota archaeon]